MGFSLSLPRAGIPGHTAACMGATVGAGWPGAHSHQEDLRTGSQPPWSADTYLLRETVASDPMLKYQ